jgi:hypothetical protein
VNLKTKQTLAILFSIGGAIGTVGTAYLARKAAMKEQKMRTPNGCIYPEIMPSTSKKEQVKKLLPVYAPTIGVGALTVGSIIGSSVMSHRAQASLMSMAVLADQGWRKYKNQVKSTLGLDTHQSLINGIAKKSLSKEDLQNIDDSNELELYFEENVGYFQAKPEDVMSAYAEINEFLNTDKGTFTNGEYDGVTIGMFLSLANARLISNVKEETLDEWGWTLEYLQEVTGNCWVHMKFTPEVTDDGVVPYKVISWIEDPIMMLDEDYDERLDLKFDEDSIEYVDLDMFRASKDKEYE